MTGRRPIECLKSHPEYCLYASETLLPLLMQLETELQGVVKDDDIEYVHRSRVATRRIRAAFHIFSECFAPDQYKKWDRQIRRLTRSLGEARDLDVQIEFVHSFISGNIHDVNNARSLFSPADAVVTAPAPETTAVTIVSEPVKTASLSLKSRLIHWIGKSRSILHNDGDHTTSSESALKENDSDVLGDSSNAAIPGLECLLLRLTQRRHLMQPGIANVATACIESHTIGEIAGELHGLKVRSMLRCTGVRPRYIYEQAFMHTMIRIAELFWFESCLSDPSQIDKHHAMRIAAKRLRYTLESYSGIFDDHLKGEIKVIKRIQEILGDIHDCDVWTDYLPRFLEDEGKRSESYFGNQRILSLIQPGISMLIEDRANARSALFQDLGVYWARLKTERFWDGLTDTLSIPVHGSCGDSSGTPVPVKIALISDIHANLPALEAVLNDATIRGATLFLNAGDSIGYGPFPNDVITLLRSRHVLSVIGNYDISILSKKWKKRSVSGQKRMAMRWAYDNLSRENRSWLEKLPRCLHLPIRGVSLMVTHGSPESVTEYLDDGTPEVRLKEIARTGGVNIMITGHSHRSAARQVDGVWFINAGSVGRAEDGDPRASYALLQLEPFSIMHIRIPYEIDRTITALRHHNLPDSFSRIIREGRPLEVVSDQDDLS